MEGLPSLLFSLSSSRRLVAATFEKRNESLDFIFPDDNLDPTYVRAFHIHRFKLLIRVFDGLHPPPEI